MIEITLTNDFHNSDIVLRVRGKRLSANQVAAARERLCGITGCTCGGFAGERGPQYLRDGNRFHIEAQQDGSATIEADA